LAYTTDGVVGLSTNPVLSRLNPLRFKNYSWFFIK
jgi:hypothetical protein